MARQQPKANKFVQDWSFLNSEVNHVNEGTDKGKVFVMPYLQFEDCPR